MNLIAKKPRPKSLTWLCIASAFSGAAWVIMLLSLIIFSLKGPIPSGLFPGLAVEYAQAGYLFMVVLILSAAMGLAGVWMMWQHKMAGFYLYSLSKAVIYFLPVAIIGTNHLTFPGLILTSIVIIIYGILITSTDKG
jgi:hypothetical protein